MSIVLRTLDNLLTEALESSAFDDQDVSVLWEEKDVSTTRIAAGGSLGTISLSTDSGETWVDKTGAEGTQIVKIIISRFNTTELHILYDEAYYTSPDNGDTYQLQLEAEPGEIFTDLSLSFDRNMIASTLGVRPAATGGVLLTGLDAGCPKILSVVADIREDKFYCYNANGQCYYMVNSGDTAFVSGSTLPDPAQAMIRGGERDGGIPGLIYVANGTNGLWKSIDGYKTAGGWEQLRKPSVLGAGAGPWYMVGIGDLVKDPTDTTPTTSVYLLFSVSGSDQDWWALHRTLETWGEHSSHPNDTAGNGIYRYAESDNILGVLVLGASPKHWKTTISGMTAFDWTETTPTTPTVLQSVIRRGPSLWFANGPTAGRASVNDVGIFTSSDDGETWAKTYDYTVSIGGQFYGPRTYCITGDQHAYFAKFKTNLSTIALYRDNVEVTTLPVALFNADPIFFGSLTGDVAFVKVFTGFVPVVRRLWKISGTTAINITPTTANVTVNTTDFANFVSPDGSIWLGRYTDTGVVRLYRTDDSGSSWTEDNTWTSIGEIVFDPGDPTIWLIRGDKDGTGTKLWKSTDSGITFPTSIVDYPEGAVVPNLIPVGIFR